MGAVEKKYAEIKVTAPQTQQAEINRRYKTEKLEASYAGILGHAIEPAIKPLGYDWKIGIALITSFAAREVFVGTMATLYSVEDQDNSTLKEKMQKAVKPDGTKVYTLGTALSLMIFYVFAMQCMSTLAIVKRETRSWLYPALQFLYMGGMAWLAARVAYVLLS